MITFTKEQLIASAHARIEFAEMMLAGELEPLKERTWSIELELARIALASLEAEPVGYFGRFDADDEDLIDQCSHNISGAFPLYTAPPAPVSMKDHQIRELVNELRDIAVEYQGTQQLRERIGRTVRAAILQGAEQTNYRAIVERIAEIIHGKVTDIDLLTVTVKSMKDKLQK
ncbi:hypothetical protein ABN213_13600 [Enterobacter hormaechei]|uniref:hypothetical protein n=1 Tax=Enterobacter hormaechei TaxID=158836 RepID=UPI0032DB42AF